MFPPYFNHTTPCPSASASNNNNNNNRVLVHGLVSMSSAIQQNVNVSLLRFPKPSATSNLPDNYLETKMRLKETLLKKERMQDDIKREQSVLEAVKPIFDKKRDDFVNSLSASPSYGTQGAMDRTTHGDFFT